MEPEYTWPIQISVCLDTVINHMHSTTYKVNRGVLNLDTISAFILDLSEARPFVNFQMRLQLGIDAMFQFKTRPLTSSNRGLTGSQFLSAFIIDELFSTSYSFYFFYFLAFYFISFCLSALSTQRRSIWNEKKNTNGKGLVGFVEFAFVFRDVRWDYTVWRHRSKKRKD